MIGFIENFLAWESSSHLATPPTNSRGETGRYKHKSQVQVTGLLIDHWDKQFPLELKLYFGVWLGLGDTFRVVYLPYHGDRTLTYTRDLLPVTCAAGKPLVTLRNVGSLCSMAVLSGAPLSRKSARERAGAATRKIKTSAVSLPSPTLACWRARPKPPCYAR